MKRGTTLIELAASLVILGVLTGLLSPTVATLQNRASVLAAREQFVALVVEARRIAGERGGSVLVVRSEPARVYLVAGTDTVRAAAWPSSPGDAAMVIGGARVGLDLAFDRAGLGRFTSATVRFRKGRSETSLIISSYGRVRRR
jgi:type II secretory pathway pseudopilin PulG